MPLDARAAPTGVADFIRWLADRFDDAGLYFGHGTDNAVDEAAWLTASVLGLVVAQLDDRLEHAIAPADRARLLAVADERLHTRKPLAYLLNEAWFAGERFYVDERVLVPRSHLGELLRERLQPWIEPGAVRRVLDVGTGSGCIAVVAALAFPQATIDASDISADALAVAAINVARHGQDARIRLRPADVYDGLGDARYDVILSNPPYVDHADMAALPDEYRHEPALALAAGDDGLSIVRRLLAGAAAHLTPHGVLIVETGNSAEQLQALLPQVAFTWLATHAGDESVFLLTAEQARQHQPLFARSLAAG